MWAGQVLGSKRDLPIEKDLGQFEELMAHFNTGWPVANLNHSETLLQVGSGLLPVPCKEIKIWIQKRTTINCG